MAEDYKEWQNVYIYIEIGNVPANIYFFQSKDERRKKLYQP